MAIQLTFPKGGALVAGGTGTVGGGVVEAMARAGVPVLFTYLGGEGRDSEAKAAAMVERLSKGGAQVRCRQMDMRDAASIEAAFDELEAWAGPVHNVVTASGAPVPFAKLADFTPEQVDAFMAGDALSYFRVFRVAVHRMRKSGGGSIACTSTIDVGKLALNNGCSGMSKGAVESMIRHIAAEEAEAGIRANSVRICWVSDGSYADAESWMAPADGKPPETYVEFASQVVRSHMAGIRLKRPCTTHEAGNVFAFLASDQASFLTGQTVRLDGGEDL